MSIRLIMRVLTDSPLRGMLQYAEIRLAEFVNEKSDYDEERGEGTCYPGLPKLAKAFGLKRRQTIDLLQRLEATGEVVIDRKSGVHNLYRIRPGAANRTSAETRTSAENRTSVEKGAELVRSTAPDRCGIPHLIYNSGTEHRNLTQGGAIAPHPSLKKGGSKSRRTAKHHPWPDGFVLSGDMRQFALDHHVDPDREFENFHIHADANGVTRVNWERAWQGWVLKAEEFNQSRNGYGVHRPASPSKLPTSDELDRRDRERLAAARAVKSA